MMQIMRGNEATALAAKLCKPNVIPAYPITPSTMFPERISEYVADGELDSYFLLAESEHSALSAAIGASSTGARVCTATADDRSRIDLAHRLAFGRPAATDEVSLGLEFLRTRGWTSYSKVLISSNEFLHVD